MPIYTYRREDGTTFDKRQHFSDAPLTVDPETGQKVFRVIQPAGVIFKGSGFYINDSKSASHSTMTSTPKSEKTEKSDKAEKSDSAGESKPSEKSEKAEKSESKPAAAEKSSTPASVTAD